MAVVLARLLFPAMRADAQCICMQSSPEEEFTAAISVFVGTVVETREDASDREYPGETRVRVEDVYKGLIGSEVIVRHGIDDRVCGTRFRAGERLTFFTGFLRQGATVTSRCSMQAANAVSVRAVAPILARYRRQLGEADDRVRQHPDDIAPQLARATFLEESGDLDRALQAYIEISTRWPGDARGWFNQGRLLVRFQSVRDAIAPLTRAVALNPGNSEARRTLDHARLRTGDPAIVAVTDFRGQPLERADLSRLNLAGRDLSRAHWRNVQITDADLTRGRLEEIDFWVVDFSRSRLQEASFAGARTLSLDLTDADLRGAWLSGAALRGARLIRTDLRGATARRASFSMANVDGARLAGADLRDASFEMATIANTDFADALLGGADLRNSRLSGVDLSRAPLAEMSLLGARFDCQTRLPPGFDPLPRVMVPVDRSCLAPGARLAYDDLNLDWVRGAIDLSELDLRRASFRRSRIHPFMFVRANLSGADFSQSRGAGDFDEANLTGADFSDAQDFHSFVIGVESAPPILDGAIFRGARLDPVAFLGRRGTTAVDLSRAHLDGAIVVCDGLLQERSAERRRRAIAWIHELRPRPRGVTLDESCGRVPELSSLR
jgi:uncharacterized protein YjbI with pentapeptide repeats